MSFSEAAMKCWSSSLSNPAVNRTLRDKAAQRPVTSTLDMRGEIAVPNQGDRVSIDEKRHEELLAFVENTLQDIRDKKSEQREGTTSALVLLGALLALLEKLPHALLCPLVQWFFATMAGAIPAAAVWFIRREQDELIAFRRRLKNIYDNQYKLRLKPITGHVFAYHDEKRSFSRWGDLVPMYVAILGLAGAVAFVWAIVS
jgi:hypothetical protein